MRYNAAISVENGADVIAIDLRGLARTTYVFIPFAANMITREKTASNRRIRGFPDASDDCPVQI
jgi:hypothetical protein